MTPKTDTKHSNTNLVDISRQLVDAKADNKRLERIYNTCQKERKAWKAKACKLEKELKSENEKLNIELKGRREDRLEIRRQISKAGHKLYESMNPRELQNIAGELMSKNEDWVLDNPDTYGAEDILKQGFTDNQINWLIELKAENVRLKEQINEKTDWDKQYKDKKMAMKKIRQDKRLYTLDKAPQIPDCVKPALKELGKRWAEHLESCEERFSADWVRLIFGVDRKAEEATK